MAVTKKNGSDTSIEQLEEGLRIEENALEESLMQQPDMFYRVSKQLALETSRRDAAKQALANIEAEVDAAIREYARDNDEKVSEKEVESKKRLSKKVRDAQDTFSELSLKVGELSALKEAFQQRGYALKDLVALYISNYYNDQAGTTARTAMNEERQRRGR